ncbi:hypothetical protein AQ619_05000 [Caulobacter henricii]|uniref:HTH marR-type domain-containing protein n=1 Tax=Caulobacter henricii TaxID=69395 RepID=A0A0P0NY86_9CAUL|nr:hypothetical protein AQ619_05000 [Caulobacter henricii]
MLERQYLDLGTDYLLQTVALLGRLFDGDVSRGLVYLTALKASSLALSKVHLPAEGELDGDDPRRPVSLSSIARALSMPVETTRRQVVRLEQDGLVDRTANGGVKVRFATLDCQELTEALAANRLNVQKLGSAVQCLLADTVSRRKSA